MSIRLPKYLDEIADEAERRKARCKFLVRYAAIHFSVDGRIHALSSACGLAPNSLAQYDTIPPLLAVKIETLLGRDLLPREMLNEVFLVATDNA